MTTAPAARRIAINVAVDASLAAVALPLASWLAAPAANPAPSLPMLAGGVAALLAAGTPFRLSFQYWRFAAMADLLGVAAAAVAAATLFALGLQMLRVPLPSPAFPVIHGLTLLVLLAVPRMGYRMLRERRLPLAGSAAAVIARPVLLVGAGEGTDLFLRALAADPAPPWRIVGLLSLGQAQTGRRIQGFAVLGSVDEAQAVLADLADDDRAPTLVITEAEISRPVMAALVAAAEAAGGRVARAPRPTALTHGGERFALQPVAIEDLLGRPQVPLDRAGMARLIEGRVVMVTGAGGTIGSELARQVAALGPSELLLLDNGEHALWQIDMELGESFPAVRRRAMLADMRDAPRLRGLMDTLRPALVFHAAALKHVPMVEANPLEGLLTNACGTRHVADAARAAGVAAMVMISTDKAVNPSSVMGATKRLAEMYCQALDGMPPPTGFGGGMACVTVRFGNVLGSTGSVVPVFQRQLARGGPLTVTHPDMQRYFMTVPEAVSLVLQASVDGVARPERHGIFVLDMGEPVRIVDLARQMIRLAGLRPEIDVPIVFTGPRPGEKLFEELFHGREPTEPTGTPGLLMAHPRTADAALVGRAIDEIEAACRAGHAGAALAALGRAVPEFARDQDAA